MTTKKSITRATQGQKDQVASVVGAFVKNLMDEIGVDREGAQKLIGDAGAFKAMLREPLMAAIRAHGTMNRFASEETSSIFTYGSRYMGPKPIAEQAAILRDVFPHLGSCNEALATQLVPPYAEGYFAIPHWSLIGRTYQEAVEKIMAAIVSRRTFFNLREGQIGPQQLKETAKKAKAFEQIRAQQVGHDILVVACQFGKHHAGRSAQRALEVMTGREFGLGAYEVGIMLLTHPERLTSHEDLCIECPGDKAAPRVGEAFSKCPRWHFSRGKLKFGFRDVVLLLAQCGSASGAPPGVRVLDSLLHVPS